MPISNVSTLYQRINKGSEGGNEFSRVMNLVLTADYKERNKELCAFSDAQGDYKGVDSYVQNYFTGFQYKFYPTPLSPQHRHSIKKSLENALEKFECLCEWVIVTPEDFMKSDVEWFEKLRKEHEFRLEPLESTNYKFKHGIYPKRPFLRLHYWGHTKIIELLLQHPHIGNKYYPELFYNSRESKFSLVKLGIDSENCNWKRFGVNSLTFEQYKINELTNKTSDILFDCFFINNSSNLYLLHSIDVQIIEMWTDIKGIPSKSLLKSLGVIEIKVDFKQKITTYNFEDPMIFNPNSPQRFKIQLVSFAERCPKNCVKLLFRFNFSEHSIETEEIYLSF